MRIRGLSLLVGVTLIAASCASSSGSASSPPSTTAGPASPTTASPEGTDVAPTPPEDDADPATDGVTRILFAGDSLMSEIHATMTAALAGSAETEFLLSPRLIRDDTQELIWQSSLDRFRPDVVVVMFSHWERLVLGAQQAEDVTDREAYSGLIAFPFTQFIAENGAQLVWLGAPPLRSTRISEVYAVQNEAYRAAADASPTTTFVDIGPALVDETGAYSDTLPNALGVVERARNIDGSHLCPGGAVLVAEAVLGPLNAVAGTAAADNWQNGDWRTQPPFDKPSECPAL